MEAITLAIAKHHRMDPLSAASGLISLIDITSSVLRYRASRHYNLLAKNYGSIIAFLVAVVLPDTARRYETIGRAILHGPSENASILRHSLIDECNMTAVAVRLRHLLLQPGSLNI